MCEPPPKEGVGIFGGGCEMLESAPGFRRYSSFCQCLQKKVGESLDRSLSRSPPLIEHSSPHFPTQLLGLGKEGPVTFPIVLRSVEQPCLDRPNQKHVLQAHGRTAKNRQGIEPWYVAQPEHI